MRLKTYAAVNLFGFFLIIVVVSAALSKMTEYLAQSVFHIGQSTESLYVVQRLEVTLLANFRDVLRAEREGRDAAWMNSLQQELDRESDELLTLLDSYVADEDERLLVQATAQAVDDYQLVVTRVTERGLQPEEIYTILTTRVDELKVLLDRLASLNLVQARALKERSNEQSRMAYNVSAGVIGLISLLLPLTALYARRGIYLPLRNVASRLKSFANNDGDDQEPIHSDQQGIGELREIAEAFNVMASRLRAQKKMQVQYLASVAHDLRNPLSAITMSTELLAEAEELKDDHRELALLLRRQATHLERIVGDLLDMAHVEAGQLEVKLTPMDLRPMVQEAVQLFKTTSSTHRFDLELPDEPVICPCDPARLNQVLVNLISNAIKYSPNKGDILVTLSRDGNQAVISVADHGLGISEEDRIAIFEPFQRGSSAATKSIPGLGLGLAAARKIIEAHRGRIAVDSLPGQGSTFSVTLPQAAPA